MIVSLLTFHNEEFAMVSKNPFYLYTLPINAPFCHREQELKDLLSFARSGTNAVLFSPRRFGKTSLTRKVQDILRHEDHAVTIFTDLFGVVSVNDVAARIAKAVFAVTHGKEPLWKQALKTIRSFRPVLKPDPERGVALSVEQASPGTQGLDLLEETMESLDRFLENNKEPVHIALDEFQEIVELKEALQIEAVMRLHIQHHSASYFFVGSRRHILLGIFNERQRPFFQSAVNYELKSLPPEEFAAFLKKQFEAEASKSCPIKMAQRLVKAVSSHPYYTQKLAHFVFETSAATVTEENISDGIEKLVLSEEPVFEAILQGLTLHQKRVLRTLAAEPTDKPLSHTYIGKHRLGSAGGIRHSINQLILLDLLEKKKDTGQLQVVDPVFSVYLRGQIEETV
jgi:hypothetical protein